MVQIFTRNRQIFDRWASLHFPGESDNDLFDRQLRLAQQGDSSLAGRRRLGVLNDGTIIGGFNINQISRGLIFEADANWWVDLAHSQQGLGTRGVSLMLAHALADLPDGLGLHRVTCGIIPANIASKRLAERVGFVRQTGVTSHLQVSDRWIRHEVYVATPDSIVAKSAA